MKRILALMLSALLLTGAAAAGGDNEAAEKQSAGFRYRVLADETAEIVEYAGEEDSLEIPETLEGHTVTSIGDEAFCLNPPGLEEIMIPDTVTHIGSLAFAYSGLLILRM